MKMLKRFLPIATIGCTALAIAPFVTSCSKKNGVDIQKIIKGEYKRQTDLAGPGTKSEAEITDFYVSAIKENKQIFVDDIYIAMSELLNELLVEEEELDPNAFSGTASISLDNIKQDITYGYRISSNWDLSINVDGLPSPILEWLGICNVEPDKMNGKIDAHLKIANLPFQIVYEEEGMLIEEPHWNMECLTEEFIDEDMWNDSQWSIDMLIDLDVTLGETPFNINLSTLISYKSPVDIIEIVFGILLVMYNGLHMQYLDNITKG